MQLIEKIAATAAGFTIVGLIAAVAVYAERYLGGR